MQKYPRGSRGSPAKGVVWETVARVRISSSAPKNAQALSCAFFGVEGLVRTRELPRVRAFSLLFALVKGRKNIICRTHVRDEIIFCKKWAYDVRVEYFWFYICGDRVRIEKMRIGRRF